MRKQLFASISTKVVIGVGAVALAAGSAGAMALTSQPISDDTSTPAGATVVDTVTGNETSAEQPRTDAEKAAAEAAKDAAKAADADHPDNFGDTVSADARDGGVDGHAISAAAHQRNEARKAAAGTPSTKAEADDDDATAEEEDADADDTDDATEAGQDHAAADRRADAGHGHGHDSHDGSSHDGDDD